MKRLAAQCAKVGLEHRFIIQKGMDHMYIPDPEVIGEIFGFFDKYLKTEALPVTTMEECDAIDPYKLVMTVPPERLPDIRIDCGLNENLLEYSQKLASLLMEHKIPFTYAQAPGRHNYASSLRSG